MTKPSGNPLPRRDLFRTAAAGAATATLLTAAPAWAQAAAARSNASPAAPSPADKAPPEDFKASSKRVRHSVMAWCFKPMKMETLIAGCARMGMEAMEGIDPKFYPLMKKQGLGVSLISSHGFAKGPVSSDNREYCVEKIREAIDRAVEWNCRNVITFTGMRAKGVSDKQAEKNCVEFWKSQVGYAAEKGVTLVLEHLNSRDDSHPMKGHPGYFGDDVDHCIDMIKKVDSPQLKLLFDVYHVQVMNGDVIRRFRQYKDYIGHVHTAGNPGRAELDDTQELNYPPIIRAIMETGYQGYIVQEFIPTWEDKLAALRHGVQVCDV